MFECCECGEERPLYELNHTCECGAQVCMDCFDNDTEMGSFCPTCISTLRDMANEDV